MPDAQLWMVTQDAPADPGVGVQVLGRLSDDDLARAYAGAWVFCLPSTYEGFGIPYAEAMSSGLPVVSTPNLGARYVTDEGRAGLLVELDELGGTLVDVLVDEELRARLQDEAHKRAHEFDLRSVVDRYLSLYSAG